MHLIVFIFAVLGAVVIGLGLLVDQPFAAKIFARSLQNALAGFSTLTRQGGTLRPGDKGFNEIGTVMLECYLKDAEGNPAPRSLKLVSIESTNIASGITFGNTGTKDFQTLSLKVTLQSGKVVEGSINNLESVLRERFEESRLRVWRNTLVIVGIFIALAAATLSYLDTLRGP